MSESINRIVEDMAANLLMQVAVTGTLTHKSILDAVSQIAPLVSSMHGSSVSSDDIVLITKRLEERFNITMTLGALFKEEHTPWLAAAKSDIDWFYWNRYKRYLIGRDFPPLVISGLDWITDQVLDNMENPRKEGKWSRRGMVVGHVQSGKTANFIGIINKAADCGYRVIIVLAGTLNSLRGQTQERVDSGFLGFDTSIPQRPPIGVGILDSRRRPASFTTAIRDFSKTLANSIGVTIQGLNEPVVLVIKKNKSTLTNLIDWLKHNNGRNLKNYPMLLIDDEADHASINTKDEGEEITAINKRIRELLNLFDRSAYVGYTATPFANVFINPDTDDQMVGEDLFPRDFIISLDPPSNYVGATRIFSSEADLDIIRKISDYEDVLPPNHTKEFVVEALPLSCVEAINAFVLARAIRLLRGQTDAHNSMLVNVSRFTKIQSQVKLLVDARVRELQQAITNFSKLREREALANPTILGLRQVWDKEFRNTGIQWVDIQPLLKEAASPVEVVEVNSSAAAASLDFSRRNYPKGRTVIAVGGLSLSRGLTLEGLTISYFLRNSIMYDTLMQMGRWFGYRDGYEDVCRIYMSSETVSWYNYISDAMEELRSEFQRMQIAGMTPKDFGLAVRSHPDSLIVTAKNKMRTGQLVTREIDLTETLVETAVLSRSSEAISRNLIALDTMVASAQMSGAFVEGTSGYYLWKTVPSTAVLDFIEAFENYPAAYLTEKRPLKDYIQWLESKGLLFWDVALVNPRDTNNSAITRRVSGLLVRAQLRAVTLEKSGGITLNKHRVASRGLEKAGLSTAKVDLAKQIYGKKENVPDRVYRSVREYPLLMLHLLDIRSESSQPLIDSGIAAYGISFPGDRGAQRPEKLVQYMVNTIWWKNTYGDLLEDDEDLGVDE